MYLLYLATCFSSPPLILAGEAGLPEKGGGFAHLDLRPVGSRVETKGAQTGGMSPSMSPVGGARIVAPFCICCAQGEMEKSRRKNLGEEERHCSNSSH